VNAGPGPAPPPESERVRRTEVRENTGRRFALSSGRHPRPVQKEDGC